MCAFNTAAAVLVAWIPLPRLRSHVSVMFNRTQLSAFCPDFGRQGVAVSVADEAVFLIYRVTLLVEVSSTY